MQSYGIQWADVIPYKKMVQLYKQEDYDPKKEKTLSLRNEELHNVIPIKLMSMFSNIVELDLSNNLIARFDGDVIFRCCKKLQKIKFDDNRLNTLVDFITLGSLEHLETLSLLNNPVTERKEGIPLLEELMFPPTLKTPNIVEIFAATYTFVQNTKDSIQREVVDPANIVYDADVARMGLRDFSKKDESSKKPITLFKKTRWAFQYIDKPCPKRKIGFFRNLKVLNGKQITMFDVMMIAGVKKSEEIVHEELQEKTMQRLEKVMQKSKTHKIEKAEPMPKKQTTE